MFTHQCNQTSVCAPNYIFHGRAIDLRNNLLLLDVIQDHCGCRAEDQTSGATVENLIRLDWGFN